jgi:hypothetical protein
MTSQLQQKGLGWTLRLFDMWVACRKRFYPILARDCCLGLFCIILLS